MMGSEIWLEYRTTTLLQISKVIAKHVLRVTELIETTEARLSTDIVDLDIESQWIKVSCIHAHLQKIIDLQSRALRELENLFPKVSGVLSGRYEFTELNNFIAFDVLEY